MEIEKIKKIISDQKEDIETFFKNEKIIKRDVDLKVLRKFLSHPNVLVISGVRRSGKSVLALQILEKEKYGYLNFDDERLAGFTSGDFNKVLEVFYELEGDLNYFIFDEIQNIKNWELFINRLRRTKKVIVTGSNAHLLSGELATHLTGRHINFTLYPFSFNEFLKYRGEEFKDRDFYSTKKIAQIKRSLNDYVAIGGFPEIYRFGKAIIGNVFEDILTKDILVRYKIKNQSAFKELANYSVSNFSQEISYSKLSHIFGIKDVHTVKNYISYLTSTYLIFVLNRFSFKLKQQIIAPRKVYCIDTGLINHLAFQFSENSGNLIENVVYLNFLHHQSYFTETGKVYYWQDHSQREVDFVVKKGRNITQLIQVCGDLKKSQTKEREIKSLLAASQDLMCDNLVIITWDEEGEEEFKGKKIKFIPLWKWLLE